MGPCMHVGDPEEASGSWLLSIPALVTVAILGVNQLMEDCFLFVSPLLFVFQINKIKQPALINSPYTCLECMETARLKTPVLTRAAGQSNALPPGLVEIGDDVRDDPDSLCLCNMNHISGRERSAMCKDNVFLSSSCCRPGRRVMYRQAHSLKCTGKTNGGCVCRSRSVAWAPLQGVPST